LVVDNADPATKKAKKGSKKKDGKGTPQASASEEQPNEPPGKEESGKPAPDVTPEPANDEVVVVPDATQDEGTRTHPLQ
jgi:hypothetical protein